MHSDFKHNMELFLVHLISECSKLWFWAPQPQRDVLPLWRFLGSSSVFNIKTPNLANKPKVNVPTKVVLSELTSFNILISLPVHRIQQDRILAQRYFGFRPDQGAWLCHVLAYPTQSQYIWKCISLNISLKSNYSGGIELKILSRACSTNDLIWAMHILLKFS